MTGREHPQLDSSFPLVQESTTAGRCLACARILSRGVARSGAVGAHLGVQVGSDSEGYVDFWRANEPRMRRALVAQYGPQDGRAATSDALSWAWEHWADVRAMASPVGYLYRVGQTAARKHQQRGRVQVSAGAASAQDPADGDLDLIDALRDLSDQQRVVLLLVHAHGYSQREAADVLDIAVSTVRVHLERAVRRLRGALEVSDGS